MLKRLWRDENGSIWLTAIFVLMVTFAFAGLALDAARFYMLHSDLQDMADAAALAGAKELDGEADAITRATDAAQHYFTDHGLNCPYTTGSPSTGNCARWWDTAGTAYASVQVYEKLGDIPGTVATDDATASFVKVTTGSWSVVPTLLTALGITSAQQTAASATAGTTFVACNVQPLMLCNPNEPNDFTATPGKVFGFTQQGGGTGFSPGDFSLLDPGGQTHSTAKEIRNLLSAAVPKFCYVNSVSPRPGQVAGDVADGINVRFDMYPQGGNAAGLDFTPSPNVLKGTLPPSNGGGNGNGNGNGGGGNSCNFTGQLTPDYTDQPITNSTGEPAQTGQLPGASDTVQQGHLYVGNQMDTSAADRYWTYHHGANWPTSGGQRLTRSQAYCTELGLGSDCFTNPADPLPNGTPNATASEPAAPTCYSRQGDRSTQIGNIGRRILSVAIVDCTAQGVQGNAGASIRSNSYAEFFLIQPVGQDGVIWTEFVRFVTPASVGSKLHQVVRLYNK